VRYEEALTSAKELISQQGGQVAPLSLSEEEISPHEPDDLTLRAVNIEATNRTYSVPYEYPDDSSVSEFRFFQDGRQRTIQIGHVPAYHGQHFLIIPVHYFVVAAAILERRDRRLEVWRAPELVHGVFVPRGLLPQPGLIEQYERQGLRVVDTDSGPVGSNDYYAFRSRALQEAKKLRLEAEQTLIRQWREDTVSADSFLVVDGTLMNMRDEANVDRCIGVSKSFGARYFDTTTHHRIMQLREFERSWTFRFHGEEESAAQRTGVRERVSWYLRLREGINKDPEFGLIRVEISKSYADQSSHYAGRFSTSLISERLPTSYPAPRWDKHLFPIRQCESYLSSIMPSSATINATMGG
jgi:hypothetical protein